MLFLIALILAFCFAILCSKPLKKYPYVFYAAAALVTIASVILSGMDLHSVPNIVNTYVIGLFTRGAFATALWCVVMWSGAFPNGSAPIKKFMPIRGELSIFAAILTLGHNIGFGRTYFVRLFTDTSRMTSNQLIASILTIVMLVIMIPLTIMSFPKIRKKMNAKLWKKIQRTAYLFYAMIYIHVLVLYYPMAKAGREGIFFNILIYSAVFIGYAVCRIRKWYLKTKKPEKKLIVNIICAAAFLILVSGVLFFARAEKKDEKKSAPTVHTYTAPTTTASADENENSVLTTTSSNGSVSQTTVSSKSGSKTTATTSAAETSTTETTETSEEETDEELEEEPEQEENYDDPEEEEQPQDVPQQTEPSYVYANGTYSASAYGYDGDVYVTIMIENDVITPVSAYSEESDQWYFDSAVDSVLSQIASSQSPNVDAVSGATYSSNAIMDAVAKALNSAKN